MKLTFKGVDISTEEKFVSYINSLNTAIMKQNAMNEIKQDLYDVSYLKKRYRKIVARNEKALFMAEHECLKCVYFKDWPRKLSGKFVSVSQKNLPEEAYLHEAVLDCSVVGIKLHPGFSISLVAMSSRTERFIEQLMEEEGRKDTDEQDMEANITEGKERQEHE